MELLSYADFSGREGEAFSIAAPAGAVSLVLESVEPLPSPAREGGAFRLTFRGPGSPALEQATYAFAAQDSEPIDIFIVPVGRNEAGTAYEAIFS